MGGIFRDDQPRLVELGSIPEFWCDGVAKVEPLGGGTFRLLLYRVHRPVDGGPIEHEVVAAVLANAASVLQALPVLHQIASDDFERVTLMVQ